MTGSVVQVEASGLDCSLTAEARPETPAPEAVSVAPTDEAAPYETLAGVSAGVLHEVAA